MFEITDMGSAGVWKYRAVGTISKTSRGRALDRPSGVACYTTASRTYLLVVEVSIYIYESVYRSMDLPSIYPSVFPSIYLARVNPLSINLSIYRTIVLSIDIWIYECNIFLPICFSIYLSSFLYISWTISKTSRGRALDRPSGVACYTTASRTYLLVVEVLSIYVSIHL